MALKREYNVIFCPRHEGNKFINLVNEQLKNPNTQLVGGVFVNEFDVFQAIVTVTGLPVFKDELVEKPQLFNEPLDKEMD